MDLMEVKIEKKIYKDFHIFNCIENGNLLGIIILKPSNMLMLKNKKCYELAIKIEIQNTNLDENLIKTNIYKFIKSNQVFNDYEIIEGIGIKDKIKINLFERLGFIKTIIENKKHIFYKIK